MIVVFVIDTSPSMGLPLASDKQSPPMPVPSSSSSSSSSSSVSSSSSSSSSGKGMSRLDLAKMAVESIVKGLNRRLNEHNTQLQKEPAATQAAMRSLGLGPSPNDELLLLSTSRQYPKRPGIAACGASGRLLVGYGEAIEQGGMEGSMDHHIAHHNHAECFQKELKRLKSAVWDPNGNAAATTTNTPSNKDPSGSSNPALFPEDAGGANGLNIALSSGLQLLSRYRLSHRTTENFGMGRLTSPAMLNPNGGTSAHALQPACLVLLTDGVCLRSLPSEGGGSLQLQYGAMPLKEFYKEPFRWDQRIFCLGIGGKEGQPSSQYLHPHLRALCEVTGGNHQMLSSTSRLSSTIDSLLRVISPPRPVGLTVPDPLQINPGTGNISGGADSARIKIEQAGTFVGGGPVCCFQSMEIAPDGSPPTKHRAMLLLTGSDQKQLTSHDVAALLPSMANSPLPPVSPETQQQAPVWCIPEAYFPNKKFDTLPPRPAQPQLLFSRYPSNLGSKSFDASVVMKMMQRLDQMTLLNMHIKSNSTQPMRLLRRDVYLCEWISVGGGRPKAPPSVAGSEHYPVLVAGAGRPILSEGEVNFLNVGILHVPRDTSTLAHAGPCNARLSTLVLLPPEPQVLLPLLLRAAETEHRALRKALAVAESQASQGQGQAHERETKPKQLSQKQLQTISKNVHLNEHWRSDFSAYLFRVPCYYLPALKWSLRALLPTSMHSLLSTDSSDGMLSSQCFSKMCLQKIRAGEQLARESNERLERQELELRRRGGHSLSAVQSKQQQQQQPQNANKRKWNGDVGSSQADASQTVYIGYGQFDPRSSVTSYLSALKNMPPPQRRRANAQTRTVLSNARKEAEASKSTGSQQGGTNNTTTAGGSSGSNNMSNSSSSSIAVSTADSKRRKVCDVLGDLPASCLLAYYESRRRWIFGGSGLTTRGIFVNGTNNDGSNAQRCSADASNKDEQLLTLAGVGASRFNATTTVKMGDYRERLIWSRAPVVGHGSNDCVGVASTTAPDGSPIWSVDDDAMPMSFFDPTTGEFLDSMQARVKSRLVINFGNPFKDKRADSIIPEKFLNQRPSAMRKNAGDDSDDLLTPPGSPPHDAFSAAEGEGEAIFSRKSPSRTSPSRIENEDESMMLEAKVAPPPSPSPYTGASVGASTSGNASTHTISPTGSAASSSASVSNASGSSSSATAVTTKDRSASGSDVQMQPTGPATSPEQPKVSAPISAPKPKSSSAAKPCPPRPPPKPSQPPKRPPPPKQPGAGRPPPPRRKGPAGNPNPSALPPAPPPSQGVAGDRSKAKGGAPPAPAPAPSSGPGAPKPPRKPKHNAPPPRPPKPPASKSVVPSAPPPRPSIVSKLPETPHVTRKTIAQAGPAAAPLDLQSPNKKPEVTLPEGWLCVWSKGQKRWYFFDTKTNRSVWQWPPQDNSI